MKLLEGVRHQAVRGRRCIREVVEQRRWDAAGAYVGHVAHAIERLAAQVDSARTLLEGPLK